MKPKIKKQPKTELAKAAERSLKRAAKTARVIASRFGTSVHIEANGKVVALRQ